MKIALVGYAQSGKKTLFTLLTGREVADHMREGKAVDGAARVVDPRVDEIARLTKPKKKTYAETQISLCPDVEAGSASRKWLESARRCDLVCVMVRAFTSPDVYHPLASVNAERDRSNLEAEVLLADLELVENRLIRLAKEKRAGQTDAQKLEQKALEKCKAALEAEKPVRQGGLEPHEQDALRSLELITTKPLLWAYNVDENALGAAAGATAAGDGRLIVSCKIESEIAQMTDPAERAAFLGDLGLSLTGAERLNAAAYETLGLMSFYTMGPDEARAWTVRKGAAAPTAAGKIHSDIERGFIRAEVISFDDLVKYGSEAEVKSHGRAQLRGKEYIIQDGDICNFLFNV